MLKSIKACCIECYNANMFVLDFESNQTAEQKMALIGAMTLVDFSYYQLTQNNNN